MSFEYILSGFVDPYEYPCRVKWRSYFDSNEKQKQNGLSLKKNELCF